MIQRKLLIGASNDPMEQEADRIAGQVLEIPVRGTSRAPVPHIQGSARGAMGQMDPAPSSVDRVLASSGKAMDPMLQAEMRQRFGHDFSQVRIHTDCFAEQSAQEMNARAYTVGHHLVFGKGQYAPGSRQGRRLIAHELTHVLQQSGGNGWASPPSPGTPVQGRLPAGPAYASRLPLLTWVQRSPSPDNDLILGGSGSTTDVVELYFYGDLEGQQTFTSRPGYPRLTDCGIATSQEEAALYTGTAIRDSLRYQYVLKIDRAYFDKYMSNQGTRKGFSEYAHTNGDLKSPRAVPIPVKYFQRIATLKVSPPRGSGGPGTPPSGGGTGKTGTEPEGTGASPPAGTASKAGSTRPGTGAGDEGTLSGSKPDTSSGGAGKVVTNVGEEGETSARVSSSTASDDVGNIVGAGEESASGVWSSMGWALVQFGLQYLLSYIGGNLQAKFEKEQIDRRWTQLLPQIQADLKLRTADVQKLLQQTKMQQTIYANVQMDLVMSRTYYANPFGEGNIEAYYSMDFVPPVKISTDNINGIGMWTKLDNYVGMQYVHRPLTYSFPIVETTRVAEPPTGFQPIIRTIHDQLASIGAALSAMRGAGHAEEIDLTVRRLSVAELATDSSNPTFKYLSGSERFFVLTRGAVNLSLKTLGNVFGTNPTQPAEHDVLARLWVVKYQIDALADTWPMTIQRHTP